MTRREAFESEAGLFAALEELQTLSRPPMPMMAHWPPWDRIRAALPPDCELPSTPVNVLVDLELDSTGLVTYAAVGHPPRSLRGGRAVAVSVGPDGRPVVEPPVPAAPDPVAEAVAAAHLGERFTPGERGGVPVAVRLVRVGVGIAPGTLQRASNA